MEYLEDSAEDEVLQSSTFEETPIELNESAENIQQPRTEKVKPTKHLKLPISKIKHMMKMDPDVQLIQQDAVSLVCKATELFIEYLTRESCKQLVGSKRKTVTKRDVDVSIETIPQLCFLDGALE